MYVVVSPFLFTPNTWMIMTNNFKDKRMLILFISMLSQYEKRSCFWIPEVQTKQALSRTKLRNHHNDASIAAKTFKQEGAGWQMYGSLFVNRVLESCLGHFDNFLFNLRKTIDLESGCIHYMGVLKLGIP